MTSAKIRLYGTLEAKQKTNKYKNIFDNQLKDTLRSQKGSVPQDSKA